MPVTVVWLFYLFIYLFIYLFQYNMREQALNKYKADLEEASDKLQQSESSVLFYNSRILLWELKEPCSNQIFTSNLTKPQQIP